MEVTDGFIIGRQKYKSLPEYNTIELHEPKIFAGYFDSEKEAQKELDNFKQFRHILPGIGTKNLEKCAQAFAEREEDDPQNLIKSQLIRDYLEHERKEPKKEMQIEETFSIEFRER